MFQINKKTLPYFLCSCCFMSAAGLAIWYKDIGASVFLTFATLLSFWRD